MMLPNNRMWVPCAVLSFLFCFCLPLSMHGQTVTIQGPTRICQGDTATLDAGAGYSAYSWSTGATSRRINITSGGDYSVTVTNAQNETFAAGISITEFPRPNPVIQGNLFICRNGSTQLAVTGGTFTFIQWSTGEQTPVISAASPNIYSVIVVDQNNCTARTQDTVRLSNVANINLPDSVRICEGDSAVFDATVQGATFYRWNNDSLIPRIVVREPMRYNVIVSDGRCVAYDTTFLVVIPPPRVDLGRDTIICNGDSVVLRAPANALYSYVWQDNSRNATLVARDSALYFVQVSFGSCRSGDSVLIEIFNKRPGRREDTVVCTPQYRLIAGVRGATSYRWQDGSRDSTFLVQRTGTYQCIASNGKCFVDQIFEVTLKKLPVVNLGKDTVLCVDLGQNEFFIRGDAPEAVNYQWSTGATSPAIRVAKAGVYRLDASNECGVATDEINVNFTNCFNVFVPTAFSPNGDSQNDVLVIYPTEDIVEVKAFRIFDRWGTLVHEALNFPPSDAPKFGWNGSFKEKPLKPDVFIYVLEMRTSRNETIVQKGDITLLR